MGIVQIRDNSLWIKHIEHDEQLVAYLSSLKEEETALLEIEGFVGPWRKMRDGADNRPTNGYKPIEETAAFWSEAQSRRGAWVPIKLAEASANIATPTVGSVLI